MNAQDIQTVKSELTLAGLPSYALTEGVMFGDGGETTVVSINEYDLEKSFSPTLEAAMRQFVVEATDKGVVITGVKS